MYFRYPTRGYSNVSQYGRFANIDKISMKSMGGKFFKAMLHVNNDRTPGPENLSLEFYHFFKEVLVDS